MTLRELINVAKTKMRREQTMIAELCCAIFNAQGRTLKRLLKPSDLTGDIKPAREATGEDLARFFGA